MAKNKRLSAAKALVNAEKLYSLDEALSVLSEYSTKCAAKFDESVDVVLRLGVDPKHSDQMVRGVVSMPHGLGKKVRVAVFVKEERRAEALEAGADLCGAEDLIDKVKAGVIDFDVCITTPDFMPKMVAVGKILGTKGLMPNPKLGTVSDNILEAVKKVKAGQVEYKVEKAGLVHAAVGKLSFSAEALKGNILAFYAAVFAAKPSASKGVYMRRAHISASQGPAVVVDLKSLMV